MENTIDTSKFDEYLEEGEKLLWTGRPKNELFKSDKQKVAGSIIFILFTVFLEVLLINAGTKLINKGGDMFFGIYIMFVLYLALIIYSINTISSVTVKREKIWNSTEYLITDKRIVVIIHKSDVYDQIIEDNIDDLTSINIIDMSLNQSGVGTIIFGEIPFKPAYVRNNDRENSRKNSFINQSIVFNNIEDVCGVYVLINEIMSN